MTSSGERAYHFGPFRLVPRERMLLREDTPLPVTPKAFSTLLVLVRNAGRLVTKEELIQSVWPDTFVEEGSLTRNISALRKLLDTPDAEDSWIETIPRAGYRLRADLRRATDIPPSERVGRARAALSHAKAEQPVRAQLAVVFCDLERSAPLWMRFPRERVEGMMAEYRYLTMSLAHSYGCLYQNFSDAACIHLFQRVDSGVQFALRLIDRWEERSRSSASARDVKPLPLHLSCHFGPCSRLAGGNGWVGRDITLARRVAGQATANSLFVTEVVLDLLDAALYEFEEVGSRSLQGDHLPQRALYRVNRFNPDALQSKPKEELTAEAWFLRAASFVGTRHENREVEAECYREALKLRPDYPEAHNNLAILLTRKGLTTEAAGHYRLALRLRPAYAEAHYNYAILLQTTGRIAGASEHFRQALKHQPEHVDAHHALANLLKSRGDLAEAEKHYLEALRLRPDSAEARNNFAILLEDAGRREESRAQYLQALSIRPDYTAAHYNYALYLENDGDWKGAESHYRLALRSWPECAEAHNNLAVLLHREGNLAGAEEHYLEAMRLRPEDPEIHYNYSLVLRAQGSFAAADEQLRLARELAPEERTFKTPIEPPA